MKRIAYLVLAHADPKHFQRLTNAIDYKAKIFVHLDAKSNIKEFKSLSLPESVQFLEERVSVFWGSMSMIDATLKLIEAALKSEEEFSHLVLISGSDYPIKRSDFIYETFAKNPNHEFIKYLDMRESPHYFRHIRQKWFRTPLLHTSNKALKFIEEGIRYVCNHKLRFKNSWDKSIIPYFGSQWWALTPNCARYILEYVDKNPRFYAMNKYTFSPDEHFFHTIVGNSHFKEKSDGVQEFKQRGTWRMANFHIIATTLSKWYTMNDWNKIIASDRLFVRKLNSTVSHELTDNIDKELLK